MTQPSSLSCPDLEAYLNGEASQLDCDVIEHHLQGCDRCREWVALERQVHACLRHANEQIPLPVWREKSQHRPKSRKKVLLYASLGIGISIAASLFLAFGLPLDRQELSGSSSLSREEPSEKLVTPKFVASRVKIDSDWLIAQHESSDDQVEIYFIRPTIRSVLNASPSTKGLSQ